MVAASASPAMTLVAAAPPEVVPFDAFQDPKFSGPTPLTIVGRSVFGHLATWGVCHIGISGECVTAPHSKRDYSDFHLGSIMTDQGELAVGTITMGTGHADMNFTATDTRHHYDHTGTAVAKVRAGEDEHGIWVAGIILDGVSDEQVRTLQSSGGLSGDWRSIGRSLELVAALAVNVPGFPVPRTSVAASAERTTSLVAAGVLVQEDRDRTDEIATAVIKQLDRRDRRKQKLAALEDTTRMARRKKIEDHGL